MKQGAADSGDRPDMALVVFSGQTDLRWLHILKPGFRHCFAVLERHHRWVTVDPLFHCTEITIIDNAEIWELIAYYCAHGLMVLPWTIVPAPRRLAPVGFYTCVESVKRILGIHAPRVITPWNLYQFLISKKY